MGEKLVGQSQLCDQLNADLTHKDAAKVSAESELATLLARHPEELARAQEQAEALKKQLNAQLALIALLKAKVEELRQRRPDKNKACQHMLILLNRLAEKLNKDLAAVRPTTEQLVQLEADIAAVQDRIKQLDQIILEMRVEWSACREESDKVADALEKKELECSKAKDQADAIRTKLQHEYDNVQLVERLIANYSRDPLAVIDLVNDAGPVHPGAQEPIIDEAWFHINSTLDAMIQHYTQLHEQSVATFENAKAALEHQCDKEKTRIETSLESKRDTLSDYETELQDKRIEVPHVEQRIASLKHNKTVSEGILIEVQQTCHRHRIESEGDDSLQREIDAIQMIIDFVEHTYEEEHISNATNTRLVTKFKEIKARLEALLQESIVKATQAYAACEDKRALLHAHIVQVTSAVLQEEQRLVDLQSRVAYLIQQVTLLVKETTDLQRSLEAHILQCHQLLQQLEADKKDYTSTVQALNVIQRLVVHIATN